jgi:hypothetical protein
MADGTSDIKKIESEDMVFSGHDDKVTFDQFDKFMGRYMRLRYGQVIGNGLWLDQMPSLEGEGMLSDADFTAHCHEVIEAISITNASKVKGLTDEYAPFWQRDYQLKWRKNEWSRMFDVVCIKCRGQALLAMEELGTENAHMTRKHLKKQFGGSSEDVKFREKVFEAGMPVKGCEQPFPKGIDIEAKLRELHAEWIKLKEICPEEDRASYEYGKESTLVKIIMKHLQHTEYARSVKDLLLEIKLQRQLVRAVRNNEVDNGNQSDDDIEDWEYRNYKDGWVPSYKRLHAKLTSQYKEMKFNKKVPKGDKDGNESSSKRLPAMLTKTTAAKLIATMLAPAFGQRNKALGKTGDKMTCWGCGKVGHRMGSSLCTAKPGEIAEGAPKRAKRKKEHDEGKVKKPTKLCKFFSETGKCRFGAACRFEHAGDGKSDDSGPKGSKKAKKGKEVTFLKTGVEESDEVADTKEIEKIVRGFLMIRLNEGDGKTESITLMRSSLIEMNSFAYDTGSGEGISVRREDFVYLDESDRQKKSVIISGPSVGKPQCIGRGPLVYLFLYEKKLMGLLHPNGILAGIPDETPEFRIASAMQMKARGIRFIGGAFDEDDVIECMWSKVKCPTMNQGGVVVMKTDGVAKDIKDTTVFRQLVERVKAGLASPLFDATPFLKEPTRHDIGSMTNNGKVRVMLMNEAKLNEDERSRLYCRRFGYCDPKIFEVMSKCQTFGKFPKLKPLNEDNIVSDLTKFKRKAFKRNDKAITMNSPPFWRVMCDGYGGQKSLGGTSYEGAVGAYLFVCAATGSTDIRLYASHKQFPIALYQFLVRVQAEFWCCRVIYVDTYSVNLSADVEEVLALFQTQLVPVSSGTPQEMAFAESKVRTIKRMSTAMLAGAPHLKPSCWALADKYAVYVSDFLPQQSRDNLSPYYLRTGRVVDWELLHIKVFGAPMVYALPDGPIHKRSAVTDEGWFVGIQWPGVFVQRKSDEKVLNIARQKVRVHESMYTVPLATRLEADAINDFHTSLALEFQGQGQDEFDSEQASDEGVKEDVRPETNKNHVWAAKFLRDHRQKLVGTSSSPMLPIEESAMYGNADQIGEGIYIDTVVNSEVDQLATKIAENTGKGMNIKDSLLKAIREAKQVVHKGGLAMGKNSRKKRQQCGDNLDAKRAKVDAGASTPGTGHAIGIAEVTEDAPSVTGEKRNGVTVRRKYKKGLLLTNKKKGGKAIARVGDLISVPATLFDETPGSYSSKYPANVFGTVKGINKKGIATIVWTEDKSTNECRLRDLTVERRKSKARDLVNHIVAYLVEGEAVSFKPKNENDWPKDFFEALVRSDWRKWVEAVKKEVDGWNDMDAVEIVPYADIPANARILPLGELYTVKRDGKYKFRQYIMGNLARKGIDYDNTFSTTISSTGMTTFYSLATTSRKLVGGWDAVQGYLQTKEQYDIYTYLPTHAGYSNLEYEEIAILRESFLKIMETEGMEGIKRFARNHKKEYRLHPESVYRCKASIYGNPSAGMEFEKLMNSVHIQTAGLTQTETEPSMYFTIKVDEKNNVTGFLVVIAFVDDVRYFGTEPEIDAYKRAVTSRLKVTFENPPVAEFISIETYQDNELGITELKMPRYFEKAKHFFKDFVMGKFKERRVPISIADEALILQEPTVQEVADAKNLPFLRALGILSYPAANCKFEMRYAISVIGSRRTGWSIKQFKVVVKLFEYALTTMDIGLMYSDGLDPHGRNIPYCFGDAALRPPRPQSGRILMMNGAALSSTSKKQTIPQSSSMAAEHVSQFDCSTEALAIRNLLTELGQCPQYPTTIYCDNQSAIKVANNRGSLGKTSRALDLKTLSLRQRIEDHQVESKYVNTNGMLADMNTKALAEDKFVQFRDVSNGYALVKAAYPNKVMSPFVFALDSSSLEALQTMIMGYSYDNVEDGDYEMMNGGSDQEQQEPVVALSINMDPGMMSSSVEDEDPDPEVAGSPDIETNHFSISDLGQKQTNNMTRFNLWGNEETPLDENDDLPDHRLYGIDLVMLNTYVEVFGMADDPGSPFQDFANYIRCIEPDEVKRAMIEQERIVVDEWYNLHADPLAAFKRRAGMFEFILGPLVSNVPLTMNRRINLALMRMENNLMVKSVDVGTDNVYWGIVTCWPSPKASWIRWQRWRFYFQHLYMQKVVGFKGEIADEPPIIRDKDKIRMEMKRWCLMNINSGQFEMLPACMDDRIPVSNVHPEHILLYDKQSIWDMRYEINHSVTVWNQSPIKTKVNVHDDRTSRLSIFLDNLKRFSLQPEWGRNANEDDGAQETQDEDISMGWGANYFDEMV